jgi:hypothetical protein
MDSPPERPSLIEDLKQIQHYGSWVLLFASLSSLTLPGLIAKLLHFDEVVSLWQLVVATAPLTLAVTAVRIAALSEKVPPPGLIFGTAIALLASLILGDMLGRQLPIKLTEVKGSLPEMIWNILAGYFRLYGGWSFATSFVVGGFLAWAWSIKLWPRIRPVVAKL